MSERLFALVLLLRCNPIDGVRFCAANDKCVCNSMGPEFLTIRSVAAGTSGGKMSARRLRPFGERRMHSLMTKPLAIQVLNSYPKVCTASRTELVSLDHFVCASGLVSVSVPEKNRHL
jgi:hypothetical protein